MPLLHLILVFAVAIVFVMVVVAATAFVTLVIDRSRSHLRRRPMSSQIVTVRLVSESAMGQKELQTLLF